MNTIPTIPNGSVRESYFQEEKLLREAWEEASLPFGDTRPETLVWFEERKSEARSALIEHRKQLAQIPSLKGEDSPTLLRLLARWVHLPSHSKTEH